MPQMSVEELGLSLVREFLSRKVGSFDQRAILPLDFLIQYMYYRFCLVDPVGIFIASVG